MISVTVYKLLHLSGLILLFASLGGQFIHYRNGGDKDHGSRKLLGITHGVALLLILVGGFGMMARLKLGFEGWLLAKLGIWVLFGGITAVAARRPGQAGKLWGLSLVLGIAGIGLVLFRPL